MPLGKSATVVFLVSSDLELEKAKWPMEPERATVKIIEEKPFVHGVHGDRKGSPLLYFGFAGDPPSDEEWRSYRLP